MHLHSPESAILSAVIFNALIIVALIPLALPGVKYRAVGAAEMLPRNSSIYGVGGLIAPFIGIKLIDLALVATAPGLTNENHTSISPDSGSANAADRHHLPAGHDRLGERSFFRRGYWIRRDD